VGLPQTFLGNRKNFEISQLRKALTVFTSRRGTSTSNVHFVGRFHPVSQPF